MSKDGVYTHFHMVIKDIEQAIASLTSDITQAFNSGDHKEVDRLNDIGRQLRAYCVEVQQLQVKWAHNFDENIRIRARYNALPANDHQEINSKKMEPVNSTAINSRLGGNNRHYRK